MRRGTRAGIAGSLLALSAGLGSGCLLPVLETQLPVDAGGTSANFGVCVALLSRASPSANAIGSVTAQLFRQTSVCPDPCTQSSNQSGACCFLAPSDALPTDLCASGSAASSGTLTFSDDTAGMELAVLTFSPGGVAQGYSTTTTFGWSGGDLLTVFSAGGPDLPAFSGKSVGLNLPDLAIPSAFSLGQSNTVSWTPDANSDNLLLEIEVFPSQLASAPLGWILCQAPDAAGALRIDAALTSGLQAGDLAQVQALRQRSVPMPLATGQISFLSQALSAGLTTQFQ